MFHAHSKRTLLCAEPWVNQCISSLQIWVADLEELHARAKLAAGQLTAFLLLMTLHCPASQYGDITSSDGRKRCCVQCLNLAANNGQAAQRFAFVSKAHQQAQQELAGAARYRMVGAKVVRRLVKLLEAYGMSSVPSFNELFKVRRAASPGWAAAAALHELTNAAIQLFCLGSIGMHRHVYDEFVARSKAVHVPGDIRHW